jgi:hypothetical protein
MTVVKIRCKGKKKKKKKKKIMKVNRMYVAVNVRFFWERNIRNAIFLFVAREKT